MRQGENLGISGRNSPSQNLAGLVSFPPMPKRQGKMVTFWLRPETASLVEQCMEGNVFPSLSDFFEAVLIVFQEHSQALLHHIEQEKARASRMRKSLACLNLRLRFGGSTTDAAAAAWRQ